MINKKSVILLFHGTSNYNDSKEMYDNIIKKFENEFKDFYIIDAYSSSAIRKMISNDEIFPSIENRLKELKNKNYKCVCFSGGFKNATLIFVEKLKLDGEFSNIFHTKNNILTGKVGGEMMFSDSKGNMLLALQKLLNISYNDTLVVGDGANDLSMFKYAKNRVAFCSKEILKKEANIIINEKDLRLLIDKI